jgi:outer membrane lipoprotein carrier protein
MRSAQNAEVHLKRFSLVVALLFAATALQAAAPIELDRAATAMSGMEASFTHRFTAKGFKTAQVEQGSVVFGDLPRMRWSYASPEKKEFIFDGTSSWFYVPADKQVTLGRVTDARKRELPFLLLGDAAARDAHFVVKQQTRNGNVVTTLQPRDKSAQMRTVSVTIAPSTHLIQRIEYVDRDGNQTSFDFSGYHRRAATADTFRFTPPAGVQVIRAD